MKMNDCSDNEKLVLGFGARRISDLSDVPDCYTFQNGLVYSHRDFDSFFESLQHGEKCAIVSGVNASGTLHIGHRAVFDTNLFFQKKYGVPVFIPISDDESYITGKVKSQEEGKIFAFQLARELLAYGFDPDKTFFIIDQCCTNIYNLAIKLCRLVNLSEIKAVYGYENSENPGMFFYPCIQSAHILLPQELFGIKNVLVPIGPDEDAHIRICRDIAQRAGYKKPSILHVEFLPGVDGEKMSKSRGNAIFLNDSLKNIEKKVYKSFSGGASTIEEHCKTGGNPDVDVSCIYLKKFFLEKSECESIFSEYREGTLLSSDVKKILSEHIIKFIQQFQERRDTISEKDVERCLLKV